MAIPNDPVTPPLDAHRWQRVNELLAAVVALPAWQRTDFLDQQCLDDRVVRDEIASLLEFVGADVSVDEGIRQAVRDTAADLPLSPVGERVGPYALVAEIGRGGMGAVYLAERIDGDFQQRVAIKIVRGLMGPDGLHRFRAERRILASLEHPHIARLLDGGTTEAGLPYLVMEYVDGVPIDTYCDTHDLPMPARLDLFLRACDAVVHAHRSLIVHRDLKPSNILVTADGTPKLLDFGIAKMLDAEGPDPRLATKTGMALMTPEYASPEQVRGAPITMATDVYSLGVLLFELLTGTRPYRFESRAAHEIALVVSLQDAPKPSAMVGLAGARALRGDLDTIVLTALSKDPARRYATVEQLADDLRRYIAGRPINARPATWRYLAGRFLARHRYAASTAALLVLVTTGFAIALALSAQRAAQERDTAERVTALLTNIFAASDPAQTRGDAVTARELLERGSARIEHDLREQPEVRAQLLDALGNVYFALGLWAPAQSLLDSAIKARRDLGDTQSLRLAATMHRLADVLLWRGQLAPAEPLIAAALEIRRRRLAGSHPDVAATLALQARAESTRGRPWTEVEPLFLDAIRIWTDALGPDTPEVAVALVQVARGRSAEGDFAGAETAARESLAIRRRAFGDGHPLTTESLATLALILDHAGRPGESETLSREVLAQRRQLYQDDDHPWIRQALNYLASVLQQQGKLAEAESISRAATDYTRMTGIPNGRAANIRVLAAILEDQGRLAEAEQSYRESLEHGRQSPTGELQVASTLVSLARVLVMTGRAAEALPLVDEAANSLRLRLGERHFQVAPALGMRGGVLAALGRPDEAEAAYREALGIQRAILPERHPALIATAAAYGAFLLDSGRAAEAEPLLLEAYRARTEGLPFGHWARGWTAVAYGAALAARGPTADGEPITRAGLSELSAALPAGDPRLRDARRLMAGPTRSHASR